MVKHIVMWTLKDEAKANADAFIADLQKRFKALLGVVDGLTDIEYGGNYNGGEYDVCLVCTFTTRAAQDAYQNHPAHLAIAADVRANACGRACVDYEL